MTTALTQFAAAGAKASEEAEGIAALGINGQAFLIQLITFALVYLVLSKYAFKPIVKMLQERRALIESGVDLGEQMKKEKAELEATVENTLAEARKEADDIIATAKDNSRDTVREAEQKAADKAAGILADAEERIKSDTARARKKLEGELVGLISDATEAIIGEKVDAKKDAQLIERALQGQKA